MVDGEQPSTIRNSTTRSANRSSVHRQEHVGMTNLVRCRLAHPHQLLQLLPFLGFQPNDPSFHTDPP